MKYNIVKDKCFSLSIKVLMLSKKLQEEIREYVMSRQLLRQETAIGALIRVSEHAVSKADFIHKLSISLK
ncbi:four helix bundle protein [Anditalea andensis]|uniref:four helix bundle protein n=1 Tax=Anditalea andensis TaxID=1048983 RepID=UPI0021CD316F|nr:four helix bundle protein [Anditalea andensis]